MVHIIKVYLQVQNSEPQIRRVAVSSEIVGNFNLLAWKIREIFPAIRSENFDVTWKDSENDVIHMSSDEELAQALANAEEGLLRIYVRVSSGQNLKEQEVPKAKPTSNQLHHPLVVCDGCDKEVYGHRYKCLQCHNYDLCSSCNSADKHPEHDMIKLVKPVQIHRNWVFLGARKMWRSMFGRCPFQFHRENPKESSATNSEKPQDDKQQWKTVVDDLLKGDFVPAEKLVKENLGHFLNFVESFADVDVRIDNPFVNQATGGDCTKNKEEKTSSETKQSDSSTIPEKPVLNKAAQTKEEETKVSDAKSDPSTITDNCETINENAATSPAFATASNISAPIKKESSPTGLFSDFETSVNVDGWTLLHDNELETKESSVPVVPVASGSNGGAIPKVNSMYPDISKTEETIEISPEQVVVEEAQNVTKPKETISVSQDPEIVNALIKMQAMGFTNEGGWLERLLLTKSGNINSALDALYPNTRRN